jgi:methylated-DNA-[protein]-cysteine S-methyltransferase
MSELLSKMPAPNLSALKGRLLRAAEDSGLLDVAYAIMPSPLGDLLLAKTKLGLVRLAFEHESREQVLGQLAARVSPRVLESPASLDEVRRELDEYFDGRRKSFDLPVDLSLAAGFRREVLRITVLRFGYGQVVTYTQVASAAGRPGAVRAAASALSTNPIPIVVPCHRVIRGDGSLAGYSGGLEKKAWLLNLESSL